MFVEGSCEVDVEELFVVDGQSHHPTSKPEVTEVVRIDIGQTVGLKRCTCMMLFTVIVTIATQQPCIVSDSIVHKKN